MHPSSSASGKKQKTSRHSDFPVYSPEHATICQQCGVGIDKNWIWGILGKFLEYVLSMYSFSSWRKFQENKSTLVAAKGATLQRSREAWSLKF